MSVCVQSTCFCQSTGGGFKSHLVTALVLSPNVLNIYLPNILLTRKKKHFCNMTIRPCWIWCLIPPAFKSASTYYTDLHKRILGNRASASLSDKMVPVLSPITVQYTSGSTLFIKIRKYIVCNLIFDLPLSTGCMYMSKTELSHDKLNFLSANVFNIYLPNILGNKKNTFVIWFLDLAEFDASIPPAFKSASTYYIDLHKRILRYRASASLSDKLIHVVCPVIVQ